MKTKQDLIDFLAKYRSQIKPEHAEEIEDIIRNMSHSQEPITERY